MGAATTRREEAEGAAESTPTVDPFESRRAGRCVYSEPTMARSGARRGSGA